MCHARSRTRSLALAALAAAASLCLLSLPRQAAAQSGAGALDGEATLQVDVNGAQHTRVGQAITRFSVAAPEIASVQAFPPDQLLVVGRMPGSTTITVWTRDNEVREIPILVTYPTTALNAELKRAIPDAKNLRVTTAGSSFVIQGQVKSVADVETAESLVKGFVQSIVGPVPPTLVNMLTVPGDYQVQLEVSFAEVSRSALRQMGMNFWGGKPDGAGGYELQGVMAAPTASVASATSSGALPPLSGAFGLVVSYATGDFPFNAALSILSARGYSRTLSEPTLVAMSGQTATFHAGGEFPIPIPMGFGQISIEFKKFGIQLNFTPTVVGDTIQLALESAVSDVDYSLGIRLSDVTVPGLTERRSTTTVRLRNGQSFAIAGLLSDRVRSSVDKIPGLGDLPVLGALFRSVSYRREETELLVVVTAHLVRPGDTRPRVPGEDTTIDPSDLELFLLGTYQSKPGGGVPRATRAPAGPVGFVR